jgi:type II secretory pathway component GspD/PulD (secretin)
LRSQTPQNFAFEQASLRDVLLALAKETGINFVVDQDLNNLDPNFKVNTTLSQVAPFAALEAVANAQGIALIKDNGTWLMRRFDDQKSIARNYQTPGGLNAKQVDEVLANVQNILAESQTASTQTGAFQPPSTPPQASVCWDSQKQAFFVVGPRSNHQWVEAYLTHYLAKSAH